MKLKLKTYVPQNRLAASVILADLGAHGGESSLAVRWARLWSSRCRHDILHGSVKQPAKGQTRLFDGR